MNLPTTKACTTLNLTKGSLARDLYGHLTYDLAIPQGICDLLSDRAGCNVSSQLVMGYPDGELTGVLLPLTQEMASFLRAQVDDADKLNQLMTWQSVGLFPAAGGGYTVEKEKVA